MQAGALARYARASAQRQPHSGCSGPIAVAGPADGAAALLVPTRSYSQSGASAGGTSRTTVYAPPAQTYPPWPRTSTPSSTPTRLPTGRSSRQRKYRCNPPLGVRTVYVSGRSRPAVYARSDSRPSMPFFRSTSITNTPFRGPVGTPCASPSAIGGPSYGFVHEHAGSLLPGLRGKRSCGVHAGRVGAVDGSTALFPFVPSTRTGVEGGPRLSLGAD